MADVKPFDGILIITAICQSYFRRVMALIFSSSVQAFCCSRSVPAFVVLAVNTITIIGAFVVVIVVTVVVVAVTVVVVAVTVVIVAVVVHHGHH